jgi:hypothetical protein
MKKFSIIVYLFLRFLFPFPGKYFYRSFLTISTNNRIYCLFIDFDNCLKRIADVVEPHLVCLIVVYYCIPLIERRLLPIGNESR